MRTLQVAVAMLTSALYAQAPQSIQIEVRNQGTASVQLENHTGRAVIGYVLLTEYRSPHAAHPIRLVTKGLCLDPHPDGAAWDQRLNPLSDPSFVPVTSLDYVIFDDGSSSGPDSAKASKQLFSMRAGVNHERDRLKLLHANSGLDAVAADLGQPLARIQPSGNASAEDDEFWKGMNIEHARLQHLYQKDGHASVLAAVEKHL